MTHTVEELEKLPRWLATYEIIKPKESTFDICAKYVCLMKDDEGGMFFAEADYHSSFSWGRKYKYDKSQVTYNIKTGIMKLIKVSKNYNV